MEEIMICPFCGRDDIYRKSSLTQHVNRCKLNPDRVEVSDEAKQKMREARKGRQPHKGKTHSTETKRKISNAQKGRTRSDETKQKISEAGKIAQNRPEVRHKKSEAIKKAMNMPEVKQKIIETQNNPEVRQKEYNTKKQNNSFNSSKIEEQLKEYFTSHNINFRTQYKSDKYPFMCDFYFPDKDLFVEIQGTWTHGGKPFDASDIGCVNQLALWKSKNKPFYLNAIDTWTNRDVRKRNYAKEHKLNWVEIFSDNLNECLEIIMKLL